MDILRPTEEAALLAWSERIRLNREQVERLSELGDRPDFYGPVAERFRADPDRTGDVNLDLLRSFARPEDSWLDIGAGGGRFALALARSVTKVIALEPAPGMQEVLRRAIVDFSVENVEIVDQRWPVEMPGVANIALISQVGYDTEQIGPFLSAMERAANRACIALWQWRAPSTPFDALWPDIHGEARIPLPALPELISVLIARGRTLSLAAGQDRVRSYASFDEIHDFTRRQVWVREGSEKDRRLRDVLRERLVELNGRVALTWEPFGISALSWSTRP